MKRIVYVGVVVVVCAVLLRVFVIDSFIVSGDSMSPTIQSGDYVFINKMDYYRHEPQRNDLIVANPSGTGGHPIIKRIIALPYEIIQISNNTVTIKKSREDQGVALSEPYLALAATSSVNTVGINYINIDPFEYFVLGDNRYASIDSRELGSINRWDIKGRVFLSFRLRDLSFKLF